MHIENIKVKNFRNLIDTDLNFNNGINFIVGNNAQGKTNIIESIYVSAFLKSFRTHKKNDLIKDKEESLFISLNTYNSGVNNTIDFFLSRNNKYLKINKKKPDKNNYYKYLNVVIFHPDEVNYISSHPVFRRNLIDRSIFYTKYNYVEIYRKYTRCLKQRNIFLKQKNNGPDYWKDQLIKYGSEIVRERIKYINKINNFFCSEKFKKIREENYLISYSKKYTDTDSIENLLAEEFFRKQERERLLGYTLVGPHKDDIYFYLNDKPAEGFASQGQKRSLVISFKMAQILDYKSVQGHYPVLILDDMTSELDSSRKNVLLENLLENSGQVFITSTDFKQINCFDRTKVFTVENGEISVAD